MEEELIGRWGPRGYPFHLRLKTYKGGRFLDIRRYYDDNPTRKGIMLRSDQLTGLVERLVEHQSRIRDWFSSESDALADRLVRLQERAEEARRESLTTPHSTPSPQKQARPGLNLFEIEFEGGKAVVKLNSDHRFYQRFHQAFADGDVATAEHLLAAVLQSCFHAAALAGGDGQRMDLEFAEQLAHFMGLILAQSDPTDD